MEIKITRFGMSPQEIIKDIQFQFISVQDGLQVLATETAKHMKELIKSTTYRAGSTGKLANSIQVEPIPGGYGVGNIAYMNQVAPYWYAMNYGSFHLVGRTVIGHYGTNSAPDLTMRGSNPGAGTERFTSSDPFFRMTVTNPIQPKNFVENTANWSSTFFRVHFANWTGKTRVFR